MVLLRPDGPATLGTIAVPRQAPPTLLAPAAPLLAQCDLVIGRGDTWPVQLAAAVGTRICGLFDGDARRQVPPRDECEEAHLVSTTPLSRLAVDAVLDLAASAS